MQAIQIQPQTFKRSYIKLIVLLCSHFNLSVFPLAVPTIASLIIFTIFGLIYLMITFGYIVIHNVKKNCKCLKVVWFVDIAYFLAGLFYYVGKNFPILARVMFECDDSCLNSLRITQPILLGMTVVICRFIPYLISKYYQPNIIKKRRTTDAKLQLVPEWIVAAESLTLLVEFDAIYTIIVNSFMQATTATNLLSCESGSQDIAAFVLWASFVLMYMFILFYTMNIQYCGNFSINCSCVTSNLGAIVLLAAFGMYLLSNTFVPLVCLRIPLILIVIMWGAMKIFVLIVVITVIVLLLVYRCLPITRQEKLLPRALAQQLQPEPDEQIYDLPMEVANTNKVINRV